MSSREKGLVAGYILAGGASRRMGRDKALLEDAGIPWLLRSAKVVREVAGNCSVVAPAGRYEELGLPVLVDRWPGEGPMGGIVTALEASDAQWNLILAVDMPFVTAALLRDLLAEARRVGGTVVPMHADGGMEPLCGIYHSDGLPRLRQFFAGGGRRVKDALRLLDATSISVPDPVLANVNTPEQWEAART